MVAVEAGRSASAVGNRNATNASTMDGDSSKVKEQRQYLLGVKNIGGNDREIDVDLLLYGSKSSESLSEPCA